MASRLDYCSMPARAQTTLLLGSLVVNARPLARSGAAPLQPTATISNLACRRGQQKKGGEGAGPAGNYGLLVGRVAHPSPSKPTEALTLKLLLATPWMGTPHIHRYAL